MFQGRNHINRRFAIYSTGILLVGMLFVGCFKDEEDTDPKLVVSPLNIDLTKENQEKRLTIQNTGKSVLEWSVFDKPDWAILSGNNVGDCSPGDTTSIMILGDLSIGIDEYLDSLTITSNGGSGVVSLSMTVDVEVPLNSVYAGETTDELAINYEVEYNKILNFNGSYAQSGQITTKNTPLFGKMTFSDTNFTVEGPDGMVLEGTYNGTNLISGSWKIDESKSVDYSVAKQN